MKKNYNKVPKRILENIKSSSERYFRVGVKKLFNSGCISNYRHLNIWLDNDGNIQIPDSVLPVAKRGRYSKYNVKGRRIRRKDLPKVEKIFSIDYYPYGNTNLSMESTTYTKLVYQVEEWIPQFYQIKTTKTDNNHELYLLFEIDLIIDKEDASFEDILLFAINLMQENIGDFEVYPENQEPHIIEEWRKVDWELLPPGQVDKRIVIERFGHRSDREIQEILERYNFIHELHPKQMIKGKNNFSRYFGAQFKNGIVVLENIEFGNAIYVLHKNWKEFSKLSRTELIKMNSKYVTRIVHKRNWKLLLKEEIERQVEEPTNEENRQ